jgi:hypothetical protein
MASNDDAVNSGKATVTPLRPGRTPNNPPQIEQQATSELVLKTVADLLNAPARHYLVKGLFGAGEMSVVCGPPKCGKSFVTAHIAYAISQGREVWFRRVKQCPVVYVALEGESGFGKRMRAMSNEHGVSEAFFSITQPVPLFKRPELADEVIALAKYVRAGLIVIDTHARAMTGGEENGAQDTGEMVGIYDRIRKETGAHVAIVHHTGKDPSKGGRGSNALLGAADAWFDVVKDDAAGTRAVELSNAKDDPNGECLNFNLTVTELGLDDDGDPITTCLVEELPAARITGKAAKRPRLSPEQKGDYDELVNLFAAPNSPAIDTRPAEGMQIQRVVTHQQLREHWEQTFRLLRNGEGNSERSDGAMRKALSDRIKRLKDRGFIGATPKYVWLIGGERYDAQ